jgi:O-antigen/teichoic acid export membrane protein
MPDLYAGAKHHSMMRERKLVAHSAFLLSGEITAAALNVATLALLARSLSPGNFGDVAVVIAYALTFDVLLNFQSWRTMIRYGSPALVEGRTNDFMQIAKFCFLLDVVSAIGATALAVAVAFFALPFFDAPEPTIVAFYCLTILFNIGGHSIGVLRSLDHFAFLSLHKGLSAAMRFVTVAGIAAFGEMSLSSALVGLVFAEVAGKVLIVGRGLFALRAQSAGRFLLVPLRGIRTKHRDIVSFSTYSNLNDSVLKVAQQVDVLIVSQLLGASAAGSFRIIKSLGSIFSMAGGSISQVIYPEMARRFASDRESVNSLLWRLIPGLLAVAVVAYVAYFIAGRMLITHLFGESYALLYGPSLLYMLGAAVGIATLPITPLFLVRGRQRELFVAYLCAGTAYLAAIIGGAGAAELYGVSTALVALYVTYLFVVGAFQFAGDRQ